MLLGRWRQAEWTHKNWGSRTLGWVTTCLTKVKKAEEEMGWEGTQTGALGTRWSQNLTWGFRGDRQGWASITRMCYYERLICVFLSFASLTIPVVLKFLILFYFILCFSFGHAPRHVGSLFPSQAWNPHPLHWKLRVLTTRLPGSPKKGHIKSK